MSLPAYVVPLSVALPLVVILVLALSLLSNSGLRRWLTTALRAVTCRTCSPFCIPRPRTEGVTSEKAGVADLEKGVSQQEVREAYLLSSLSSASRFHLQHAQLGLVDSLRSSLALGRPSLGTPASSSSTTPGTSTTNLVPRVPSKYAGPRDTWWDAYNSFAILLPSVRIF